jgi:hypothetical protein
MLEKVDNKEASARLSAAKEALVKYYNCAGTSEEQYEIYLARCAVDDEIVVLEIKKMNGASAEYSPLTDSMKDINVLLKKLCSEVDQTVSAVETAAEIATTLTKVIKLLA